MDELTTVDLVIVAPRAADRIRRRDRAAQRRAAGVIRHSGRADGRVRQAETGRVGPNRAGAGAGGSAAPAR
jgi:hypothetical protein